MRFSEFFFTSEYPADTPDGITLMGKLLKTRIIPVYLSEDDPRRAPMEFEDDPELIGREDRHRKQIPLPFTCLYRCAESGNKWRVAGLENFITICSNSTDLEVIDPHDEELYVKHYTLTSRKDDEDPAAQEFEYRVTGEEVTVTGVRYYCERIHIPAVLDGKPVTGVAIPVQDELFYLRELILPDSVRTIDFCWELLDLEEIQVPETAVLTAPPDRLNLRRWFHNQPEGPVYFQNYYLGTKGMEDAKELVIRDGTLGCILWTDCERTWEAITFPASFRHMGDSSFSRSADCRLTVPDECEEVKAHFARRCRPKPPTIRRRESK